MKQHNSGFVALVNDAKTRIQETDVATVRARLNNGESLTIIDVREESEWARGHVPGAVHIGKGVIECFIEREFPDKSAELILYCGGGYRSALAADALMKMGYTNVISIEGGYSAWLQS